MNDFFLWCLLQFIFQNVIQATTIQNSTVYEAFTEKTKMPYKLSDMTVTPFPASLFNDGNGPRMYIVGGCVVDQTCFISNQTSGAYFCQCDESTDKVIYYLPQKDTYVYSSPLIYSRTQHNSARLGDKLYVIGGRDGNGNIVPYTEMYDPVKDVWTAIGPNISRSNGAVFSYADRYLYYAGGYDEDYTSHNSVIIIDTFNNYSVSFGTNMSIGRGDTRVQEVGGLAYVIGGFSSEESFGFCKPLNLVETYNPDTNKWNVERHLKYARGDMCLAVLAGYIFAIAGETISDPNTTCSLSIPVANTERYDLASNTWSFEAPIPADRFRFEGSEYNNTETGDYAIYLFGGQGLFNASSLIYPITDATFRYVPESVCCATHHTTLPPGAVAGITVGVVALVAILLVLLGVVYWRRTRFYKSTDLLQVPAETETMNPAINKEVDVDMEMSHSEREFSAVTNSKGNIVENDP